MAGPMSIFASPQNVSDAQEARRTEEMGGNFLQAQHAVIGGALANAFGDPQVRKAQRMQKIVQGANAIQPVEGEDPITTQMRRLQNIRDALAQTDPDVAQQIDMQMLQLGEQQLQRKLLLAKETREEELHPLEVAAAGNKALEGAAEGQNYWRYKIPGQPDSGVLRRNVSATDVKLREQLRQEGWTEGPGPTTEAEAGAGLTKKTETDLQASMLGADEQLASLRSMYGGYDPDWLKIPDQVLMSGRAGLEKAGIKLSPEQAGKLEKYTSFRRDSADFINRYIKYITGAQMSQLEADRLRKGAPDYERDGPTQFMTNLRSTVKQLIGVRKRAEAAMLNGLQPQGDQWNGIAMPPVTDADVDEFLKSGGAEQALPPGAMRATIDGKSVILVPTGK